MEDVGTGDFGTPPSAPAVEQEQIASVSILLQIMMLGLAFVMGHILRRHKFHYLHEAGASLLIGIFAGIIANISNTEERFRKWFNFHEEFFFLFLLPPIILLDLTQSGFSLQPKPFFSNFGAICTFAVLGTFISSVVTGILVYLGGLFFLMYKLSFQESLIFGSLISATDPVTVLGIFQELGTDVNLYALVFGESVLNDAVAISLYRSFMSTRQHPSADRNFLAVIWNFLFIFVGSMSTGVAVALICALLFKYAGLAVNNLQNLECCLIVLFPYAAYMLAEGVGLSGIVAILFCGILMKHYTFSNLSESAQTFTAGFFHLISSLAETFVFIYMGVDIAIEKHSWSHVGFIFFSIIFIVVARAANVFPCAYIVNYFRSEEKQIPATHQKALWAAGLRGAMAFALALQSVHDLPTGHGRAIVTTTTAVVVLTVLVIGGGTSTMLEKLDVVGDSHGTSNGEGSDEEIERLRPSDDESDSSSPTHRLKMKLRAFRRNTNFSTIDKNFLRPFFTSEHKEERNREIRNIETPNGSTLTSNSQLLNKQQTNAIAEGRPRRLPSGSIGVQIENKDRPTAVEERTIQASSNPTQLKDSRQRSGSPILK